MNEGQALNSELSGPTGLLVWRDRFPWLAAVVGILAVILYLVTALQRLTHPFCLEWLEGAMVDHVLRVVDGQSLYVKPSIEFVPFVYSPFYYYVAALFTAIVGEGYLPLRLVSLLASLGSFWIIFRIVRHETASSRFGLVAVGLFAAMYRLGGYWFDIGRVDMLSIFFLLAGIHLVQMGDERKYVIAGALFMFLAFFTKQTALAVVPALGLSLLAINWRSAVLFAGIFVTALVSTSWLFDSMSDGWYSYYVFELPGSHPIIYSDLISFWTTRIMVKPTLSISLILSTVALWQFVSMTPWQKWSYWLLVTGAITAGAMLSNAHEGSYDNVLIPFHAMLAILASIGGYRLCELARNCSRSVSISLTAFISLALLFQFGQLLENPNLKVPDQADREAGYRLIESLSQIEGEIFVPQLGYLSRRAGKKSYVHEIAWTDIRKSSNKEEWHRLQEQYDQVIRTGKFKAIVVDRKDLGGWIRPEFYEAFGELLTDSDSTLYPAIGYPARPEVIYTPRQIRRE